ncbi:DDHD-domain-containing protein [Nadsonia fulvescens var. elongata DSM 6958]|uniref:DDHD-domain-containing protein n=1 Tax=Nadsonia fulvescens var. elongata DSM 6958 TaxID=857566 RepID=A0A1E3PR17_9ASCO|nr:DDHD-domain-containing protein [Nadsonia fulvescens var. elongata DSM 6958]
MIKIRCRSTSPQSRLISSSTILRNDRHTIDHPNKLCPKSAPPRTKLDYLKLFTRNKIKIPPLLQPRWFFATDIPKIKPKWMSLEAFNGTGHNSKISEVSSTTSKPKKYAAFSQQDSKRLEDTYQKYLKRIPDNNNVCFRDLPVQEDELFSVNLEKLELAPVYWDGPIYEVKRGTWFIKNGADSVPCDADLAEQLEAGYLEKQPYDSDKYEKLKRKASGTVWKLKDNYKDKDVVFNDDGKTAWILSNDFYGRLTSTLMMRISTGLVVGATKVTRGYIEKGSEDDEESKIDHMISEYKKAQQRLKQEGIEVIEENGDDSLKSILQKEIKNFGKDQDRALTIKKENTILKNEMENDYGLTEDSNLENSSIFNTSVAEKDKDVDHLLLCIHGIGQRAGKRVESINFVHDVNIFRQQIKKVFLNQENEDLHEIIEPKTIGTQDCKIQVLPVLWRQNVKFGINCDEPGMPGRTVTLEDITIRTIRSIRNLGGDLILDVLLYYQPHYQKQIIESTVSECNRVYRKFLERNPNFKGKVSFIGHSLGSVIGFDILCNEGQSSKLGPSASHRLLEFDVDSFFQVGSPVGLFQLLKGNRVGPRDLNSNVIDATMTNSVASPLLRQLYNIYHPCDPIAYRLEPLISRASIDIPPKLVPYTKPGLTTQIHELSTLGHRFASGAASVWESISGVFGNSNNPERSPLDKIVVDVVEEVVDQQGRPREPVRPDMDVLMAQAVEELKQLNPTGRVDYALQEGMLDISVIAAIASHISYFEDQDVANFVLRALYLDNNTTKTHGFNAKR